MDKTLETSLIAACRDFFGYRPGTGLAEFRDEYKALTPGDLDEIRKGLIKEGYNIK
jgi:hypothetical protein